VGVWLADPARGVVQRLGSGVYPVWSPDGRELAVLRLFDDGPEIARLLLSAPEDVRRMTPEPLVAVPTGWHIDGDIVAVAALSMVTRVDVLTLSVSDGAVRTIAGTTSAESAARFSPDGTWLAFEIDDVVHVQPYPGPGRRVQVSPGAGAGPVWSPDGRELYYQRGSQLMAVPFSATDGVTGPPRMLFERAGQLEDISPDGRFLFRVSDGEDEPMRPLVAALGWLDRVLR
jgi:Tol biopolymer transport system component